MPLEHWMMFSTFAEQDFFVYPKVGAYSGVLINANMAAHAPAGLASFIIGKLGNDTKYMVDPITHAFQHDPVYISNSNGGIKSSVKTLAENFGDPVSGIAGERSLFPSDLTGNNIEPFVINVLEFQRNHLYNYMKQTDNAKYLEEHEIKRPSAIISPYFYLTETEWQSWLAVNLKCLSLSIANASSFGCIWAEIVVDKGILLDSKICESIIEGYSAFSGKVEGCILWVDNFDEQDVSIAELRAFREFSGKIKTLFPNVLNLHGGYFSVMLSRGEQNQCLTGVAHGPEFGEFRSVVPVGGGIPIAKYYIPHLHSRVRFREAVDIFSTAGWLKSASPFFTNVCDCSECVETIGNDIKRFIQFGEGEVKTVRRGRGMVRIEFPSTSTKIHCLKHYLQRKQREYDMVRSCQPGAIISEIKESINRYQSLSGNSGVAHLIRWINALGYQYP